MKRPALHGAAAPAASGVIRPVLPQVAAPAQPVPGRQSAVPDTPAAAAAPWVQAPPPARTPAPAGSGIAKWFGSPARRNGDWAPNHVPRPVAGNRVRPLTSVVEYYAAVAATIRAAGTYVGDAIYIAGWTLDLDTAVAGKHAATLGQLLRDAVARGVAVRVLLDSSLHNGAGNAVTGALIAGFGGGAVVDDCRHLFGSQHQKVVIGCVGNDVVAYCGSADFEDARLGALGRGGTVVKPEDYMLHPDARTSAPWHEVAVRIEGGAAADIWQTFALRYQEALAAQAASGAKHRVFGPTGLIYPGAAAAAATPGNAMVQIVRTLPHPHARIDPFDLSGLPVAEQVLLGPIFSVPYLAAQAKGGYDFAPVGEIGYYLALLHAIRMAEETIYLEDQYLVDTVGTAERSAITTALARTLAKPGFKKLVIVIAGTGTIQGELGQAASRRRAFYRQLGAAAVSKVAVYRFKGDMSSPYWFHSKTWIFDDACAVVGSANCNRRSYACDAELGAVIADGSASGMSLVKRLRMDLCLKHLNNHAAASTGATHYTDSAVDDFMTAAATFAGVAAGTTGTLAVAPIDTDMTPDQCPTPLTNAVLARTGGSPRVGKALDDVARLCREQLWNVIDAQAQSR